MSSTDDDNDITSITLISPIANGGFGTVFKARCNSGRELAVKRIPVSRYNPMNRDDVVSGTPCLFEASLMTAYHHHHINTSIAIHSDSSYLYIIQELATTDMKDYIFRHDVVKPMILRWFYNMVEGLYYLHTNDIVHGDIKSSNVLVYEGSDNIMVKLSDYSLSTMDYWSKSYSPCTSSHRPPEALDRSNRWGKPVDIWALGCTLFYLYHRYHLFKCQNHDNKLSNAIMDWQEWRRSNLIDCDRTTQIRICRHEIPYESFVLKESFDPSDPINKLIIAMLNPNPNDRPTCHHLLHHHLFSEFSSNGCVINNSYRCIKPARSMSSKTITRMIDKTSGYMKTTRDTVSIRSVIDLTLTLYNRLEFDMSEYSDSIKLKGCFWIAYKLVMRLPYPIRKLTSNIHQLLQLERKICESLQFDLHRYQRQYCCI